jgi:hypothetical protein
MVEIAWEQFMSVEADKNYFAYVGYAERKSVWSFFSMLMRSQKVAKQLKTTKGLVGFTARAGLFNKQVIQLAVFTDKESLEAFAHSGQHADCASNTKSSLKFLNNTTWSIMGSDVPPKIDNEVKRVQEQK